MRPPKSAYIFSTITPRIYREIMKKKETYGKLPDGRILDISRERGNDIFEKKGNEWVPFKGTLDELKSIKILTAEELRSSRSQFVTLNKRLN